MTQLASSIPGNRFPKGTPIMLLTIGKNRKDNIHFTAEASVSIRK
ncbi:hypothetical protein FM115_07800 [Marinilactibacillus psychrotolerans 42ea]|uniref:Uncharacterized protein n=1 Tax=Marinilactibacillus psychrotolerans 42ea TaxID=1255609 RepID=A0A1R4K1Y0_9LACT|nr:hypothetical protein FM115_07800 [Marinilactibacillus psychrotolerans 42ea]